MNQKSNHMKGPGPHSEGEDLEVARLGNDPLSGTGLFCN